MAIPEAVAAYQGQCPWCLEDIEEGQAIGKAETEGEWMHLDCAREADE